MEDTVERGFSRALGQEKRGALAPEVRWKVRIRARLQSCRKVKLKNRLQALQSSL